MSQSLTPTEEKVYQYLIEFLAANSYQPSIREIGRQFEIKSTKTVSDVLGSLARKGYIQRNQARSRGLRILGAHSGASSAPRALPYFATVPLIGAPGSDDQSGSAISVDSRLVSGERAFFARVSDNAMASRYIRRDDTVLVDPDLAPAAGDLVAARIGTNVIVRAISMNGSECTLTGANPDTPEITFSSANDQIILGTVRGAFCVSLHGLDAVETGAAA
jgi:repressor LexA